MTGRYGRGVTPAPGPSRSVWPPRSDLVPEPLLSIIHAVVLGGLADHLGVQTGRHNPTLVEALGPDWPAVRRAVTAFVHDEHDLQGRVRRHLDELAAAHPGPVPLGSPLGHDDPIAIVRHQLIATLHEDAGFLRPVTTSDLRSSLYWAEWRDLNPLPDKVSPTAAQGTPLGLDLGMATPQVVRRLLSAAMPVSLNAYVQERNRPLAGGIRLDVRRLADVVAPYHVDVAVTLLERALVKTHLIGALGHDEIVAMNVEPAHHPCGIDVFGSEYPGSLGDYTWAITGRVADSTSMILEWGRHAYLDFGEDEDLMFAEWDVPAMLAAADDPYCVKADGLRERAGELMGRRGRLG